MRRFGFSVAVVAALVLSATSTVGSASTWRQSSTTTTTVAIEPLAPTWTQVTDEASRNIDEVGLARTADGVVHVLWRERLAPLQDQITHTPIIGGKLGPSTAASGPWASAGNPAVVVTSDGGLRILFPGLTGTNHTRDGMQSASSDASGAEWITDPTRVSETESAIGEGVGATVDPDGTPVFVFAYSFVLGVHVGLDPADPDTDLLPGVACCAYQPQVVYDSAGTGFVGWYSNVKDEEGLWVLEIGSPVEEKALVPRSVTDGKILAISQRMPLTTLPGRPGAWVAYCSGYPRCTEVLLWEVGSSSPVTVATGIDVEAVNIAATSDGRLWVMWEDAQRRTLHATRTDPGATRAGAVVTFSRPEGATTVWKLKGIASDDGLDVFASVDTPVAHAATWYTEIRPGLTVEQHAKKRKRVVFTVTDAGEPVQGVAVDTGKKSLTTNKKGRTKAVKRKKVADVVEAAKSGYSPTTVAFSR